MSKTFAKDSGATVDSEYVGRVTNGRNVMSSNSKFTIVTKLWLLSGLLVGIIVLVGSVGIWNLSQIIQDSDKALKTDFPALRAAGLVDMMHDGIRGNVYHAIILSGSKDAAEIASVREEGAEFAKTINDNIEAMRLLQLDEETKKNLAAASGPLNAYLAQAEKVRSLALSGKVEAAMNEVANFDASFKELEATLEKVSDGVAKEHEIAAQETQKHAAKAVNLGLGLSILGSLLGFALAFYLIRSLKRVLRGVIADLSNESKTVTNSSQILTSAANGLSAATAQQASALQETAASVDEITAMVKKTSENSKQLEQSAQHSNRAAAKGQEAVSQMLQSMKVIAEANTKITNQVEDGNLKITEIVKVIGEIGNKTKVINDIVFQTKLLSFNASVEAARAGEHGKGFAVVAEEVGNLAQMSGNAAKEISEMLSASLSRVEGIVSDSKKRVDTLVGEGKEKLALGTSVARQCGDALDDIVKHTETVTSMVAEITTAIQEQNQGIQEISKAIQLLDQATHQNAVTTTETSHTSAALLNQAGSLRAIVGTLEQMVTGVNQPQPEAAPINQNQAEPKKMTSPSNVVALEPRSRTSRPVATPIVGQNAVGAGGLPAADDPRFQDV